MGRLHCRILLLVGVSIFVSADDGWRRVLEPVARNDGRARSTDSGARIPFSPEDRVVPPPWLIPPNPKHLGFPPERPKVMSFFDEDPSEFLPWPLKGSPNSQGAQSRQHQQSHHDLSSFLQPPPVKKEAPVHPTAAPQHQSISRQDQRQVPVYQPKPLLSPPPATLPPSVANLRQLPSTMLANERRDESFRTLAEPQPKPTAAPIAQNEPLEASRRKSVRPIYDSSEYDYEDEGAVAPSHDEMPLNARTEKQQPDHAFIDEEEAAYYDNQRRRQGVQKNSPQPNSNKNKQRPSAPETHDYEQFDPEETIFRTQVSSQFRPQEPPRYQNGPFDEEVQAREEEEELYVAEEPEERPAARPNKGHSARKQPVPAQQSGRDRSPPETSRFETERPHFKPEQQPDWPYRPPQPTGSRKSKPKPPPVTELPDEHMEDASFESGRTKVKSTPPPPPPPPTFFAPAEPEDQPKQRRPTQQRNSAEKLNVKNKQTDFDQGPEQQGPLDGASRFQQRNPHQGSSRRAKPTQPTQPPYEPASFTPNEEQPVDYPEFQPAERRPSQRRPVRPTKPKPETVEPEPFDGIDDEPLIPFSVPSPRPKRPQNSAPLQVPKDGTLATKGLQTLKTIAALQSNERQPAARPQEPIEEKVKTEARRPSKRPPSSRYQPPIADTETKSSEERYPGESDPIPFGFFDVPAGKESHDFGEERSDEIPLPPTPKPSVKQTTTAEPAVSVEAEEKKPTTLFPPFNKRARPTPTTPSPAPEKVEVKKQNEKEPAPVLPRITSYKQRIEAMKERVRIQQNQQQAQPKKDDNAPEPVDATTTTTTTTTRRPTTRAKFPTRMPTKRPITVAMSTTESAVIEKELPTFDESRRRFKPKNSFGRKPEVKHEVPESNSRSDVEEDSPKKDQLPKLSDHPYRRNQQKDKGQSEDVKPEETPIRQPNKDPGRRRPSFGRTTARPLPEPEDDEPVPRPVVKKPLKTLSDSKPEPEEEPTIELVEVTSGDNAADRKPDSSEHDEPKPVEVAEHFDPTQQPFVEKPERSDEESDQVDDASLHSSTRERLPIFTMATNDPMLPIEELLNIRIRDDGKGM